MLAETETRPTILVISNISPQIPGAGAEIRLYYLLQRISSKFPTAVFGGPECQTQAMGLVSCTQKGVVVQPRPGQPAAVSGICRTAIAVLRTMRTLLLPMRNSWADYLAFVSRAQSAIHDAAKSSIALAGWKLTAIHFFLISRLLSIPPYAAYYAGRQLLPGGSASCDQQTRDFFSEVKVVWIDATQAWLAAENLLEILGIGKHVPRVLGGHNVEWLISHRLSCNEPDWWRRQFLKTESILYRRFEAFVHNQAAAAFHCSDEDRELARQLSADAAVHVIPNGVDPEYYAGTDSDRSEIPTLFYPGTFNYRPNTEAATHLVRQILPEVRLLAGRVRLILAGRNARCLQSLVADDPDIIIRDTPEDIRPTFREGWIMPVPLTSAGGTRLKILEAMSMRRAVVSTPVGAEGMRVRSGVELVLSDLEQMPAAIATLIHNESDRRAIEATAHKWVQENMSWDVCTKPIPKLLEQVIYAHTTR